MAMLNLKESEQIEAEQEMQKNNSGNRNLIVIICVVIAFNYAWYSFDPSSGDPFIRNSLTGKFAGVLGSTLGLLFFPIVISLIAKLFTNKWQYVFGGIFLINLLLNFAGRFAR